MKKKLFLAFNFYGAGNIGDDLMISGFLQAARHLDTFEITCYLPRDSTSQKQRFPQINWQEGNFNSQEYQPDIYIGIGGTPFQVRSGCWLLNSILDDFEKVGRKIPKYFIAVGAEEESRVQFDKIYRILQQIEHLSTRDKSTSDFLSQNWDVVPGKISLGGDLANICLNTIFDSEQKNLARKYMLGIDYYSERKDSGFEKVLRGFLKDLSKNHDCVYFANEVRPEFEERFYKEIISGSIFQRPISKIKFYKPNYSVRDINKFVNHYLDYQVVLASRYHALLAAAWAGCRIVALPRSSKVSNLAAELGIESLNKSCTINDIYRAFENAKPVDRKVLVTLVARAKSCVEDFLSYVR